MKRVLIILLALASVIPAGASGIYHNNWIDFNKNGRKDVYEDPKQPVEKRIDDLLSRMTLEEKTCQLVTLYGCDRVIHEPLPTEGWKSRRVRLSLSPKDLQILDKDMNWTVEPGEFELMLGAKVPSIPGNPRQA